LGADEVLFVRKHREVEQSQSAAQLGPSSDSPARKDKKHKSKDKDKDRDLDGSKKIKKEKKSKSKDKTEEKEAKSSKKTSAVTASLNLLDLDFGFGSPVVVDQTESKKDVKEGKEKDKSKKDKNNTVWLQLYTGRSIDIFYSLGDFGIKRITFKLVNRGPAGLSISTDLQFKSLSPLHSLTGNTVKLSHHLPSSSESLSHMDVESPEIINGNIQIPSNLRIMLESSSGVETITANATLRIPVCSTFNPNVLTEENFMAGIQKSSSRWGSSNARVISAIKPKYAFKSISTFLRAHTVEAESSKAVSLSAKSASGAKVFCLLKASKENNSVIVDIKVLGSSKPDSQSMADSLAVALGELNL
jgi:hypothetical protein